MVIMELPEVVEGAELEAEKPTKEAMVVLVLSLYATLIQKRTVHR